jgi:hypothetical protein
MNSEAGKNGRSRRKGFAVALTATAVVAGILIPSGAAFAGSDSRTCSSGRSANGSSTSTYAATTTPGLDYCGAARARALYVAYPGSPTYYSGWATNNGTAIAQPGNQVVGGQHSVNNPAPAYTGSFPFSTSS